MTALECAAMLGINPLAVYVLCATGRLPHLRAGTTICIHIDALQALAPTEDEMTAIRNTYTRGVGPDGEGDEHE